MELTTAWPELSRWRRCSIVEEDRDVTVPPLELAPCEIATIRLRSPAPPLESPSMAAKAISDKEIELRWTPVAGAVQCHLFRGSEADFSAEAWHFLGATAATHWNDDWLDRNRTYYYRLAAVDAQNQQGALSAVAAVRTADAPDSPPAPVGAHYNGLIWRPCAWHAQEPDRLYLLWGRSQESDVACYELHRGRQADFAPAPATLIAQVPPGDYTVVSYDDDGLEPGTTYWYRVQAVDRAGLRGPLSDPWCGTTRQAPR